MNEITSVTRDDGVVFNIGDRVVLLPMKEYERSHPLHKHVGEEITIEAFETTFNKVFGNTFCIRIPAPERGYSLSYWSWRVSALEHVNTSSCSISDEDFDSVFDGGANESEKVEGDSEQR